MGISSEHFSEEELRCHCPCGENKCTQELVDALEAFRALVGGPVVVVDAYRSPEHNASTPNAAKASQHQYGTAADVRVPGKTAAELEAIARQVPAIKGIGRNDHNNVLHVDVRLKPAQWAYDAAGESVPYYPPVDKNA